MTRMDRYLLGEMVLPFVGGVGLIVVMLISNTLFPLIEVIVKNSIPLPVVAKLIVFNVPALLVLALPASVAFAAAWVINRLARDSEITPIRMAGVPLRRLFAPIFFVGLAASVASFFIGDRLVPRAQHEFQQTQAQMFSYALAASPTLAANKVFTFENYAFHVREIRKDPNGDPHKLQLFGVTIFENAPDGRGYPILYTAKSASYDHDIWTLHDVVIRTFDADGFIRNEIGGRGNSATLDLHVPLNSLAENAVQMPAELTMKELGQQKDALARIGQDNSVVAVNYYMKLSLPFVCLALALCAPPLALRFARAGAYMGIFICWVMVWAAWVTMLITKFAAVSGKMPPVWAAWTPDLLFTALGLLFLWRAE